MGINVMNEFITNLMGRMTTEEKIDQLNLAVPSAHSTEETELMTGTVTTSNTDDKIAKGLAGGLLNIRGPSNVRRYQDIALQSRLGILLLFGLDVIHGHKIAFPTPLALSATWDMNLIKSTARAAAKEAVADGIKWVYSPMVDIARDARWGRIAEGSGEDVYLGCRIAEAMVEGYQGDDLSERNSVMACVKHLAGYGFAESGRDYNTVDMSNLKLAEVVLPPFKAAMKAGAGSCMTAFSDINGIPATMNKWLMTTISRHQWGFNGFLFLILLV